MYCDCITKSYSGNSCLKMILCHSNTISGIGIDLGLLGGMKDGLQCLGKLTMKAIGKLGSLRLAVHQSVDIWCRLRRCDQCSQEAEVL